MEPADRRMEDRQQTEEELLGEIGSLARRIARRVVRERDRAEDIAQNVVLDCLESLRNGTWRVTEPTLEAYVACLVKRRRADMRRRVRSAAVRDRGHLRELEETPHAWMQPDIAMEERELMTLYKATLAKLPELPRRASLMVREAGESYVSAAEMLGITPKAVAAHVTRAQHVFREVLSARGYDVHQGRSSRPLGAPADPAEEGDLSAEAEAPAELGNEAAAEPGPSEEERAIRERLRRAAAHLRAEIAKRDAKERELEERRAASSEVEIESR